MATLSLFGGEMTRRRHDDERNAQSIRALSAGLQRVELVRSGRNGADQSVAAVAEEVAASH